MSNKVLEHVAVKYNSVKEVKAVMGGKILEYEAKTIKQVKGVIFVFWVGATRTVP